MNVDMSKEEEHKKYLKENVNPILEKLVVDLLISKPKNVVMEEIEKKSGVEKNRNAYGESSEEEEEEVGELIEKNAPSNTNAPVTIKPLRTSVSAEVYGKFNAKGSYKPREIPKNAEQISRIKKRLESAFMFSELEEKDTQIVINAFEEKRFNAGDNVIKQGEKGDELYVIDSGELDCYKTFKKEDGDVHLKVYKPGEAFGELALLYNAPRAATVIAKTECILFALDRECFNHIVKDAAAKKRERYENLLSSIELLDSMDPYEKSKIADALKPLKFREGDFVVKQGDKGDTFFFVESGEAVATKVVKEGEPPEEVYRYKPGDYFGELALLRDAPRAANIVASTDLNLVYLDRQSFKRLLGPLEDILQRNFSRYQKFIF